MLCAITPAVLFVVNLRMYKVPDLSTDLSKKMPAVSVLIPARDEAHGIEAAVASVLESTGVKLEVIVMDDSSTDGTGALVAAMAARDSRVRLEQAPKLPIGWNGKQHACWSLAHVARHDVFCFVDADVRLAPEALARMAAFLQTTDSSLVSGFPRQVTETFMEWLLLPADSLCTAGISADGSHAEDDRSGIRGGVRAVPDGRAASLLRDGWSCGD